MLIRIVRMTFRPNELDAFEAIFAASKAQIQAFPGCQHVELLYDIDMPNARVTYSLWDSPDALENYRKSDFFRTTWAKTKVLFSEKAVAFSLGKT
jgi:heme-degrading monooxygenase HmoA